MTRHAQFPKLKAVASTVDKPRHRAYLGLGSNLQQPQLQIQHAVQALRQAPGLYVTAVSSLYQSAASDVTSIQPDYINAVVAIDTTLDPEVLLAATMRIEQAQGRVRTHERNGARTIDIDLLLYDELQCHTSNLTLPHPRMHLRAFVLRPLAEIAPSAKVPGYGAAESLLQGLSHESADDVRRVAGAPKWI